MSDSRPSTADEKSPPSELALSQTKSKHGFFGRNKSKNTDTEQVDNEKDSSTLVTPAEPELNPVGFQELFRSVQTN